MRIFNSAVSDLRTGSKLLHFLSKANDFDACDGDVQKEGGGKGDW